MEMKDLDEMLDMTGYIEEGTVTQRFIPMMVPPEYSNLLNLEMGTPIIMVAVSYTHLTLPTIA